MRIALAQINTTVGDVSGNTSKILGAIDEARDQGAQVLVAPELAVTGYPPEDLVWKGTFVEANRRAVDEIAERTGDLIVVFGFVEEAGRELYNAAAIAHGGELVGVYRKHRLPNYGVFDERRYFAVGRGHTLIDTGAAVIGVCVCEDAWFDPGPLISQGDAGAQLVLNINASPYHKNKLDERSAMLSERARRAGAAIVYVNAVGGQDELVFDGGSLVIGPDGSELVRFPQFEELIATTEVPPGNAGEAKHPSIRRVQTSLRKVEDGELYRGTDQRLSDVAEIYEALKLALQDYASKNGFAKIVVGLSGGIDSTLTAAIAADAIGAENVTGVAMPSEFSSDHSLSDAKELAGNLGLEYLVIPIKPIYTSYLDSLRETFGEVPHGLAEENIQARIRGNLLMAISNRYGHLVVATGNKSEMAVGYATLYGDMAGGFALLKDVFKTEVYELTRYRNQGTGVIPPGVLTKPPSAELRPDQKDVDSLPPYDRLDPILEAYIEKDQDLGDIVEAGHDPEVVGRVITMVDRTEYKRRQAPPGPKVTTKAFGRDRRLPITNGWRGTASG